MNGEIKRFLNGFACSRASLSFFLPQITQMEEIIEAFDNLEARPFLLVLLVAQFLTTNEPLVRVGFFVGVFAALAAWEWASPRRRREIPRALRWTSNIGIVIFDTILVRVVFPVLPVGLALVAEERGWGLLNFWQLPWWFEFGCSLLLMDLALYLQHVMFHAVPTLWRLHRMHHADLEFDVTTGIRFHPIEILLSLGIKLGVVFVIGPSAIAVLVFEVILNASSMFSHSNVRMPLRADRLLRMIIVTPDMHRVHHSISPEETNSNFGFNLAWWDRLLGTYRSGPKDGHQNMTIGIEQFRTQEDLRMDRMLVQPFRGTAIDYPINRDNITK